MPWHHAMLIRHGLPFWDELYGDNHWRRLVLGRHGDRGTFEYFLRELGYAVLPWIALAPAALAYAVMRPVRDVRRQGIFWFGAIWFVSAYALVSMSVTKFHHYILPALPGLAIVIGCFLDDLLERRDGRAAGAAAVVGIPLLALVMVDLVGAQNGAQHFIWLFSYDYINTPAGPALAARARLPAGAHRLRRAVRASRPLALGWRRCSARRAAGGCALAAVAFTFFLLDGYMRKVTPYWSQKGLIATYYKTRRSPDEKLLVWQMYWRGENFYTENEIYEGPERGAHGLPGRPERREPQGLDRQAPRPPRLLRGRAQPEVPAPGHRAPETKKTLKIVDESNMKFSAMTYATARARRPPRFVLGAAVDGLEPVRPATKPISADATDAGGDAGSDIAVDTGVDTGPSLSFGWDWNGIVGTGQSLAVGGLGTPITATTQPYGNLKLALNGAVVPPFDSTLAPLSMTPLIEPIRPTDPRYPSAYPGNLDGETRTPRWPTRSPRWPCWRARPTTSACTPRSASRGSR